MLDSVKITNLGCFDEVECGIPLRPLTVLVGPNNAGKSTVFTAIHMMRNAVLNRGLYGPNPSTPFSNFVDAVYGHDTKRVITLRAKTVAAPQEVTFQFTQPAGNITSPRDNAFNALTSLFRQRFGYLTFQRSRVAIFSNVARGPPTELFDPSGTDIIQFYLERFADRDPAYDVAASWLTRVDPALRVLKSPLSRSGAASLSSTLEKGTRRFDVNLAFQGVGIQNAAIIVAAIQFSPNGSTILIEEPENHLHPGSQEVVADLINDAVLNREMQVIVTTHSRALVNVYLSDVGTAGHRGSQHVRMTPEKFEMLSVTNEGERPAVAVENMDLHYLRMKEHLKVLLG